MTGIYNWVLFYCNLTSIFFPIMNEDLFISILILFHIAYRLTRLIYDISQFVDENKPTITLILGYKFIDP